jgi:RHS repeat-associated protein
MRSLSANEVKAEPFGVIAWNQNPNGAEALMFDLRFHGPVFDAAIWLCRNLSQYHNPMVGSYIKSYPIWQVGGANTYNYVWAERPAKVSKFLALAFIKIKKF